ncbi:hypothetical protein NUITMVP1_04020 [Proteus mirabilis]|nr:hypothetical protein NUITMVP1_04020 [Proteus mirabilis]
MLYSYLGKFLRINILNNNLFARKKMKNNKKKAHNTEPENNNAVLKTSTPQKFDNSSTCKN